MRELRLGVLSEHDLGQWRVDNARGVRPFPLPYGIHVLESLGWQIAEIKNISTLSQYLTKLEHRNGYPWRKALNLADLRSCDVVIALLETQAWAYATLRRAMPFLPPLVTLECWLANDIRTAPNEGVLDLVTRAKKLGPILSLSRTQTAILRGAGLPSKSLHSLRFGVDIDFFSPGAEEVEGIKGPVLCVGQDRGRDFATFFRAMSLVSAEALVVAPSRALPTVAPPKNVVVADPVDHVTYRDLMRKASVVVVPTYDLAYPTGQSVLLEAAAVGTPVVVTTTPAMSEYVDPAWCHTVNVGDAQAMARAVTDSLESPAEARQRAERFRHRVLIEHTAESMWHPVDEVLRGVIG